MSIITAEWNVASLTRCIFGKMTTFLIPTQHSNPFPHSLFSHTMKTCLIMIWSSADSDCPGMWHCSLVEVPFCLTGSCSLPLLVYANVSTLLTTTSRHILEDSNLQNVFQSQVPLSVRWSWCSTVLATPDLRSKILFMETHGKIWCASKKWEKMHYSITFFCHNLR